MGQQTLLKAGDLCYYWRDAPAGSTAKLRWRGSATVIMREPGSAGPNSDAYLLGHGTVPLRAAPEHVKPAQMAQDLTREGDGPFGLCQTGFAEHQEQRSHTIHRPGQDQQATGDKKWTLKMKKEKMIETEILFKSTNYLQINGSPVTMDECGLESTMCLEGASTFLNLLLRYLYTSSSLSGRPASAVGLRIQNIVRIRDEWNNPHGSRELHYLWTGTTTFYVDADRMSEPYEATTPMDSDRDDGDEPEGPMDDDQPDTTPAGRSPPPTTTSMPAPSRPSNAPHVSPTTSTNNAAPTDAELPEVPPTPITVLEPEPLEEPQVPPSVVSDIPMPEGQKPFFVPERKETFAEQRSRLERQETLLDQKA